MGARTIVCGLDRSDEARAALREAARLGRELPARLVLVHVAPPPTVPGASVVSAATGTLRRLEAGEGERLLAELAAAEGLDDDGHEHAERRVVFGDPAAELVRAAEEAGADFLVVGSRGRGPVSGALLGSVSAAVIRDAPCPVVVVPPA